MADEALDRLCRQFDIDREAAGTAAQAAAGDDTPWYLRLAVGLGAWLTAAAMIVAVGLVLVQAVGDRNLPVAAAVFGVVLAAGGAGFHRAAGGAFATQFAVAAVLAGQALAVGGLAAETESMAVATLAACAAAAALIPAVRDPEHQFLSCCLAVGTALAALILEEVPHAGGLLLLAMLPVAVTLLVRPVPALDLRGMAWALLLTPLAAMSVPGVGGLDDDWLPRAVYAAGLVATLALRAQHTPAAARSMVAAAAGVAALVAAVAAAGIAGSLLLLALAYLLGSRMLAAVGVVAHVWFVSRFYYDLDLTLLEKSGMLAAAGLLLLALWWGWTRSAGPRSAGPRSAGPRSAGPEAGHN